jgi:hypothetical protein
MATLSRGRSRAPTLGIEGQPAQDAGQVQGTLDQTYAERRAGAVMVAADFAVDITGRGHRDLRLVTLRESRMEGVVAREFVHVAIE